MGMSEWPTDHDPPIEKTTRAPLTSPSADRPSRAELLRIAKAVAGGALAGVVFLELIR